MKSVSEGKAVAVLGAREPHHWSRADEKQLAVKIHRETSGKG